jgi:LPS sulfotransferase NodH
MRILLRRLIHWALAPTAAERLRLGMQADETTLRWMERRREEARASLPTINQTRVEGRNDA